MPTARKTQAEHAHTGTGDDDVFLTLAIKQGPKFYGRHKHGTKQEITAVLKQYVEDSDGLLREVLSILLGLHLKADEEVSGTAQNATGGYPNTVVWGDCGSCALSNGQPGRTYTVTVNGTTFAPDCYPCSPGG